MATRLTAWYFASSFSLILIATGVLYVTLAKGLIRQDDLLLLSKVHVLRTVLQAEQRDDTVIAQEVGEDADAPRQTYIRVLSDTGAVLHESRGMSLEFSPSVFPAPTPAGGDIAPAVTARGAASGKLFRMLSARVAPHHMAANGETVVQIASDVSDDEELLAEYRKVLVIVLGLALVICALVAHQVARAGLRPLRRIIRVTSEIGSTTLDRRVDPNRFPREIRELATTFNDMLDRLEGSFMRLRQFSDDIAHELRTPVNNMLVGTEVALGKARTVDEYRGILESNIEDCERLARIVQSLLFLARSENRQTTIEQEAVDVGRELSLMCEFYEGAASEAGIKLSSRTEPPGLIATLDRTLFQRAISNLVANGIRYTKSGGTVRLVAQEQCGALLVEVADTGQGIAPEHLPRLFDRFYRADPTRAAGTRSVGLGLSIVKSIAELHGGKVELRSKLGEGTIVILTLPSTAAPRSAVQHYRTVI